MSDSKDKYIKYVKTTTFGSHIFDLLKKHDLVSLFSEMVEPSYAPQNKENNMNTVEANILTGVENHTKKWLAGETKTMPVLIVPYVPTPNTFKYVPTKTQEALHGVGEQSGNGSLLSGLAGTIGEKWELAPVLQTYAKTYAHARKCVILPTSCGVVVLFPYKPYQSNTPLYWNVPFDWNTYVENLDILKLTIEEMNFAVHVYFPLLGMCQHTTHMKAELEGALAGTLGQLANHTYVKKPADLKLSELPTNTLDFSLEEKNDMQTAAHSVFYTMLSAQNKVFEKFTTEFTTEKVTTEPTWPTWNVEQHEMLFAKPLPPIPEDLASKVQEALQKAIETKKPTQWSATSSDVLVPSKKLKTKSKKPMWVAILDDED